MEESPKSRRPRPAPKKATPPVVDTAQPTVAQMQQRIDELTALLTRSLSQDAAVEETPTLGETHLIHFVRSGFSAFGTVWDATQEVEITVGSSHWNATLDKSGRSWVLFTKEEQEKRYKAHYFSPGPWTGKALSDLKVEDFQKLESVEGGPAVTTRDIEHLAEAEATRARRIPSVDVRQYLVNQDK